MSQLWTPSARSDVPAIVMSDAQLVQAAMNRALQRAVRLTVRAARKPLGSNGRTKDLADARSLLAGVFAVADEQGWRATLERVDGVSQLRATLAQLK